MRIFLAIELPNTIRCKVRDVQIEYQDQIRNDGEETPKSAIHTLNSIKWVEEENIHLTLKFLGELTEGKIQILIRGSKDSLKNLSPFSLSLKDMGVFPSWSRASVIWVGVAAGREEVIRIYKRLEDILSSLQFEKEGRPFTPHVTIGRIKRRGANFNRNFELKRPDSDFSTETFHIEKVSIMKSNLTPTGPIYERIESIPLGESGKN
jgi:2'-5' RNA ligase